MGQHGGVQRTTACVCVNEAVSKQCLYQEGGTQTYIAFLGFPSNTLQRQPKDLIASEEYKGYIKSYSHYGFVLFFGFFLKSAA